LTNISYRIHQFRIKEAGERRRKLNNPELPKINGYWPVIFPPCLGKKENKCTFIDDRGCKR
jgi:hypothetical protein